MPEVVCEDLSTWQRVGSLLQARRAELGEPNLTAFARRTGVSRRLLDDLERGRRPNFKRSTIAAVEHTYRLEPGSIAAALSGGDLVPIGGDSGMGNDREWEHPHDQAVWDLEGVSAETKLLMIQMMHEERDAKTQDERRSRRTG